MRDHFFSVVSSSNNWLWLVHDDNKHASEHSITFTPNPGLAKNVLFVECLTEFYQLFLIWKETGILFDCYCCALLKASPFPGIKKSYNITLIYRIVTHELFIHLCQLVYFRTWFRQNINFWKIIITNFVTMPDSKLLRHFVLWVQFICMSTSKNNINLFFLFSLIPACRIDENRFSILIVVINLYRKSIKMEN